jgi:uncharacterized protein YkwD
MRMNLLTSLLFFCLAAEARAESLDAWKDRLFVEINKARAAGATCSGRRMPSSSPLSREENLGKAAQRHADDMHARRFFSHVSLDQQGPFERIAMNGYTYSLAAENIAAGVVDPALVVQQWLRTAGACEAMMNPKFRDLGLGVVVDKASRLRVWWVANFGKKAL